MTPDSTLGQPLTGLSQAVSFSGTAGTSTAFPQNVGVVRLLTTSDCFITITVIGTAAVANTELYLPAGMAEYFKVPPNAKVSAIQVGTAGTLYITPMA